MSELKIEPIGCSVATAEQITGLSKSKIYEGINAGLIEAKKDGRITIVMVPSLREYVSSLPNYDPTRVPSEIKAALEGRRIKRETAKTAAQQSQVRKNRPGPGSER